MPWSTTEFVSNEEYAESDGGRKSDVLGGCTHGENSTNRNRATENEKVKENADETVEPY